MCDKRIYHLCLLIGLMGIAILITPSVKLSRVHAQEATPLVDYGTFIKSHEDLYFMHDAGNWFCIRKSPMWRVGCHGGDPSSIKKEGAHAIRKVHPVLNKDIPKVQECYPEECEGRVVKFDKVTGNSEVLLAIPYQTKPVHAAEEPLVAAIAKPDEYPAWISAMEIIALVLITGLALIIYFVHKKHHK
jgi:hypothetical protein